MGAQVIVSPSGERLVVLPEAEYAALVEAAEDAADGAAVETFRQRLARGEEELVPASVVERLLAGENRIRVWREHRGLGVGALAERAGIAQAYLSQIEAGRREGRLDTLRRIADALSVTLDDIAG
ncbi:MULTISPECIES: helix-turn-helix domain-containing protein [Methylobacterium]|uniref:helix-turn-helix domain-containing protein n=1 Tax=Methylobacterium TaxID=407 RepID=UPI00104C051F|nr:MULTISPECIES: helix-turn-helix transcriptional regulator [Methylobacterium]MDR7038359.1 DNA-binding XRE family transcriptional regulator [Methylobacterium sp. BE186]